MKLDEILGTIGGCRSVEELKFFLHSYSEHLGFSSFSFLDIGHPGLDNPFGVTTHKASWHDTYKDNGFVHFDPMLPIARRTNHPFHWGAVALPQKKAARTPAVLKIMQAARDHGYREGLVVPIHFADTIGRINSASSGFFWEQDEAQFFSMLQHHKHEMHIIMVYWAQKMSDIAAQELGRRQKFVNEEGEHIVQNILTDRERDVLSWAAQGKTMLETATILTISDATVETHLKNAMRKLCADNKTHAVAKAIYLGFIDV
ncbi:MAG: autoinducer binding domain-containing protein [Pseudomonadota bacterium]